MKIKEILKLITVYAVIYLICTCIFILLFHTKFLSAMTVLMYKGLAYIVLTGFLAAFLMGLIYKTKKFELCSVKDIIMMFCIFCCVNTVLFTMIPVTVERSVSVFMLSYMDESSQNSFTQKDIETIFEDKYVNEYGAFEKRFSEQIVSGNIEKNSDGTYSITDGGRFIVSMFRTVAKWFDTDQRLVHPLK